MINERRLFWMGVAAVAVSVAALPALASDNLPPAISVVGGGEAGAGGGGAKPRGAGGVWQLAGGVRVGLVRDVGYDPFATNDALPFFSLAIARALSHAPTGFIPAIGVVWENGSQGADARGSHASLSLQRLALALEGRFAPRREIYLAARVVPGVVLGSATLSDPSAPAELGTTWNAFSVDASAGVAARLTPVAAPVGLWLMADGGYGWTAKHDLVLTPRLPPADKIKAGPTDLGSLNTSGPFMRFWLALSY